MAYQLSVRLESLLDDGAKGPMALHFVLARLSQGRIHTSSEPCHSMSVLLQLDQLIDRVDFLHEIQDQQQNLTNRFSDERIAKDLSTVQELLAQQPDEASSFLLKDLLQV